MAVRCTLIFAAFLIAFLYSALGLPANEAGAPGATPLKRVEIFGALRDGLDAASIPADGIELEPARTAPGDGDQVQLLLHYRTKNETRQWGVGIHGKTLTEEDTISRDLPPWTLYTSSGLELTYSRYPSAVAIRVVGPYVKRSSSDQESARKARDFWSGTYVNEDFLTIGLDRSCAARLRVSRSHKAGTSLPGMEARGVPFPEDEAKRTLAQLRAAGFTEMDERSFVGSFLAMQEFLGIAAKTPDLGDVLLDLLGISKLGVVMKGGKLPEFSFNFSPTPFEQDPVEWGLPADAPLFALPVEVRVDGRLAATCSLVVTKPVAPLTVCSGIVGLTAQQIGGEESELSVRIVAARLPADKRD